MKRLPDRSSLDHLKKQAKDLLRLYKSGDAEAIARFRAALPAAAGKGDGEITGLGLRLHDAQSCLAREYGFLSWSDLKAYVDAKAAQAGDAAANRLRWLRLIYGGDTAGGNHRPKPAIAARMLAESPGLTNGDPYTACAIGDEAALQAAIRDDPEWVNRPGGPLKLPPLVALTHSSLLRLPAFRDRLHASARLLLDAGANPDQSIPSRWPPASLDNPSDEFALSALYGAAGQHHDAELAKLLLSAGANPNDGESLYHSLEDLACARSLLEAGARIEGSNAVYRVLDLDDVAVLRLLLSHGANPNEPPPGAPTNEWGSPLLWAIRRRRSRAHIEALLQAGADPRAKTPGGAGAYSLALQFGLTEAAELLKQSGAADDVSEADKFVAACARGDEQDARRRQAARPDLPQALAESQLRLLPELAAEGCNKAVMLMVKLGWPISVRGGDWSASALNHAVFRGDAALTRFLLEHGAKWTERHGFGDDACGGLSWASINEPVPDGDWVGCAQALVAHGMPGARRDPTSPDHVFLGERRTWFAEDVTDFLLAAGEQQ